MKKQFISENNTVTPLDFVCSYGILLWSIVVFTISSTPKKKPSLPSGNINVLLQKRTCLFWKVLKRRDFFFNHSNSRGPQRTDAGEIKINNSKTIISSIPHFHMPTICCPNCVSVFKHIILYTRIVTHTHTVGTVFCVCERKA